MTTSLFAQSNFGGRINGVGGPLEDIGTGTNVTGATSMFNRIISNTIGLLTVIAGIWFIFQLILGAYSFLSAGGDEKGVETAKKKITNAILGLFVVVASYAIVYLVGRLLGLQILRPDSFIVNIWT